VPVRAPVQVVPAPVRAAEDNCKAEG